MDVREDPTRDDGWPGLTEADRRAIAEIRRELDAEYGPIEEEAAPPAEPAFAREPGENPFPRLAVALLLVAGWGGVTALALRAIARPPAAAVVADGEPAPSATARPAETPPPAAPSPPAAPAPAPPVGVGASADLPPRAVVEPHEVAAALEAWLDATRRGDLNAQMAFYPPVVAVYYTWRDVPADAVLAEKKRVFGDAWVLEIRTGEPEIELSLGGTAAVTRFRKAYVIEGPRVSRRGEVLQELRWIRTSEGWKITSERDAAVLSAGGPG